AQFQLDASQSVPASTEVPACTSINTKLDKGQFCSFRTCFPVTLWPLKVTNASVSTANRFSSPGIGADVAAVIRVELQCLGNLRLSQIPVGSIRFYLNGEIFLVHTLYEYLFLNTVRIALRPLRARDGTPSLVLPASSLQQVGFDRTQGILPYSDRSFLG